MHNIIQLNKQHSKKALYLEFHLCGSQKNVSHACQKLREYFRISFLIIISYLSFLFLPFPSFGFFSSFFFLKNEAGKKSKCIFFFHKQNQYKGGFSDNVIQTANVHSSYIISSSCQSIVKIQDEEGKKTEIKSLRCCQKFQKFVAEPLYNDFLGIANDYFTPNCLIYRKEPRHNKTLL